MQQPAGVVLVCGDVDELLRLEVCIHKAVHPGEVVLRAGGHGDHVLSSGAHEGGGVEFALGDDAFRSVQYGVNVVGDQLGALHHHEVLAAAAVLGVDERAVFEIVEAEAVFQFVAFGQHDAFFGDAQFGQQVLRQAAFLCPVPFQVLAEFCLGGVEDGAAEVGGELAGTVVFFF